MERSEAKPRRATIDLASLNVPELDRPIAFSVFANDADPHEIGFLTVCADQKGIRLRWVGEKVDEWTGDWADLRWFLEALARDRQELQQREAEREALRAQVALGEAMAIEREQQLFARKQSHRIGVER